MKPQKSKIPEEETFLIERMRNLLISKETEWVEKRMMGGTCFMIDDKMACGTFKGGLMCRLEPDEMEAFLSRTGVEPMSLGGKPMKGFFIVQSEGYESDEDLAFWIDKCLEFNPKAKSSKKRK